MSNPPEALPKRAWRLLALVACLVAIVVGELSSPTHVSRGPVVPDGAVVSECNSHENATGESLSPVTAGAGISPATAEPKRKSYRARVVVFVAEGLTLPDILARPGSFHGAPDAELFFPVAQELRGISALALRGSVGLMSPTVVGPLSPESACLTLGAGKRGSATESLSQAFDTEDAGRRVRELYREETGREAPSGAVLNVGIRESAEHSRLHHSLAHPGALGDWLKGQKLRAGVLGNGDRDGKPRRHATALVMDGDGAVPHGSVEKAAGEANSEERTVFEQQFAGLLRACQVVVVDLGGPGPAEKGSESPSAAAVARHRLVRRMDSVLVSLLGYVNPGRTAVLFLSTVPDESDWYRLRLTPWLLVRPRTPPGLLCSSSTRTPGLVSNVDFAATVVSLLDRAQPRGLCGRPAEILKWSPRQSWARVKDMDRYCATQVRGQFVFASLAIVLGVLVAVAASLVVGFRERVRPLWSARTRVLLLSVMALPLASVLLSPAYSSSGPLLWPGIVGLAVLVGALGFVTGGRRLGSLCVVCALTLWTLGLDVANGGEFMSRAFGGHSAIWGRFYGIGNASAGVALACWLLLVGAGLSVRPGLPRSGALQTVAALLGVGVTLAIGLPFVGANLGASATFAVAVALATLTLSRPRMAWSRRVLWGAAAGLAMVVAVVAVDVVRGAGTPAHFAGAFTSLRQSGPAALCAVYQRKLTHNLWLMQVSPVTYGLLATYALFAYFLYRPVGLLDVAWKCFPALRAAFCAVPVAAVVAFLLNDTGLAFLAWMGLLIGPAFVYVLLEAKEQVVEERGASQAKLNLEEPHGALVGA